MIVDVTHVAAKVIDSMKNKISLNRISLSSGESISVADGVTAVVGPNNTGKSSLLREVRDLLKSPRHSRKSIMLKVTSDISLTFEGTAEGFFQDLSNLHGLRGPGRYNYGDLSNPHVVMNGSTIVDQSEVSAYWNSPDGLGNQLASFFCRYLNAEERLGLTNSVSSFDTYRELPSSPLQILFSNREMESRLNELSLEAFKTGVVVNRYAGSVVNLHAGMVLEPEGTSPQSAAYLSEINSLPLLHEQGDGMRAFVGMVMSIITNQTPLLLIDEPEAFLHPPQARMFGRFLADFAQEESGAQVILATHSEDIIAGLTSSTSPQAGISIARLTRNGNSNHVAQLSADAVHELYEDPLMKHYDMLNGLFTTGVVLCEADSDCTYYRAAIESWSSEEYSFIQEAHFTHASGKARIAQAMKTFKETAVPAVAIFDIDILQNDGEFYKLVDVIGADRDRVTPLRNTILSWASSNATKVKRVAASAEITAILEKGNADELSNSEIKKIQQVFSQKSGWRNLKTAGISILSGDTASAFTGLSEYLETFGIFILEQGELERLHPDIPQGNKADWLRKTVEENLYKNSPAAPMLKRASRFLSDAQMKVAVSRGPLPA